MIGLDTIKSYLYKPIDYGIGKTLAIAPLIPVIATKLDTVKSYFHIAIKIPDGFNKLLEVIASIKKNQISKNYLAPLMSFIDAKIESPHFNEKIKEALKSKNVFGPPYTKFDTEPDHVTQIKKLINALYYANLAFKAIEDLDPFWYRSCELVPVFWYIIPDAYQACHLLTHLDLDPTGVFKEEQKQIVVLLQYLQTFTNSHAQATETLAENIKNYPISHTIGTITGTAIDKMKAKNGEEPDWKFITQFAADLPGYIAEFNKYIEDLSPGLISKASDLLSQESNQNKENLAKLQNAADELLKNLNKLKGGDFVISYQILNYINILQNTITLFNSTREEMHKVSDSSQKLIIDHLTQLKYHVIPTLLGLADKIEVNFLLQPGTLSKGLMEQLNRLYDENLIPFLKKPVEFDEQREALLSLEDAQFINIRLQFTDIRIERIRKKLFIHEEETNAFTKFFALLNKYSNTSLHKLPEDTKSKLRYYYKIIKSYVEQADIKLDETIVNALNYEKNDSIATRLYNAWNPYTPADHISNLLTQQANLKKGLTKKENTLKLHLQLNTDVRDAVNRRNTKLILYPYKEITNPFIINESLGLQCSQEELKQFKFTDESGTLLSSFEKLHSEHVLDLHKWYQNKQNKLLHAKNDYLRFMQLINTVQADLVSNKKIDQETRNTLKKLYSQVQPYFIHAIQNIQDVDKSLVAWLNTNDDDALKTTPVGLLEQETYFTQHIEHILSEWKKRSDILLKTANSKRKTEYENAPLEIKKDLYDRAHNVIKTTNLSNTFKKFRINMYQKIEWLSDSMQNELKIKLPEWVEYNTLLAQHKEEMRQKKEKEQETTLDKALKIQLPKPYPELDEYNTTLVQDKRIITFKRIFNCIHHIEEFILHLENLNNDSLKVTYIYEVGSAYYEIHQLNALVIELQADPYLNAIAQDMLDESQNFLAVIQEYSDAFQTPAEQIPSPEKIQMTSLWYALNAFHISPKYIRMLSDNNYITSDELEEAQMKAKKASANIESIINSSDSPFHLFLKFPVMVNLFRNFKNKVYEFTATTHDAVMDNLEELQNNIFTPMLIEADKWEQNLGLKSGIVSDPLNKIIQEYFKGLIEPMGLHSKTHISLVCDEAPTDKRIDIYKETLNTAQKKLNQLDNEHTLIDNLNKALKQYNNINTGPLPAYCVKGIIINDLKQAYTKALPQLVFLSSELNIPNKKKSPEIDEILNNSTKEYDKKLEDIQDLAISGLHFYKGLKKSYQMEANLAQDKLGQLTELKEQQKVTKSEFIQNYTEQAFEKKLDDFYKRHVNLHYTAKEYRDNLRTYLLWFRDSIIEESKTKEDINLSIETLLQEKIPLFEKYNRKKYDKMDSIKDALYQFTSYLIRVQTEIEKDSSYSEDMKTYEAKSRAINELDDLFLTEKKQKTAAEEQEAKEKQELLIQKLHVYFSSSKEEQKNLDEEMDTLFIDETQFLDDRLEELHKKATSNAFIDTILEERKFPKFSMGYLVQCLLYLFEVIGLYTPTRKILLTSLKTAATNEPTNRHGFFTPQPTPNSPNVVTTTNSNVARV